MTPAARLQAVIELVDEVASAAREDGPAADTLISRYFRVRRYAGSKDRRAIRDLAYEAIRLFETPPDSGRAALIALAERDRPELLELFDGSRHAPAQVALEEQGANPGALPRWLRDAFAEEITEADIASLAGRAPLDLRVNTMHAARDAVLAELPGAEPGMLSPRAIRLAGHPNVEQLPVREQGLIDIQDEGSQMIADICGAARGMTIVDLCAGGGGKTLALYDAVAGKARIVACDSDRQRLAKLAPRAAHCRMPDIETRLVDAGREGEALADLQAGADIVLVDAPCSGTGTWRRNPEARWRLTEKRVAAYAARQRHILDFAAPLVRPGGVLVYAVCSLLAAEGKGQMSEFLASHSAFRKDALDINGPVPSGAGFLLTPARHGSDGFFFARLVKSC